VEIFESENNFIAKKITSAYNILLGKYVIFIEFSIRMKGFVYGVHVRVFKDNLTPLMSSQYCWKSLLDIFLLPLFCIKFLIHFIRLKSALTLTSLFGGKLFSKPFPTITNWLGGNQLPPVTAIGWWKAVESTENSLPSEPFLNTRYSNREIISEKSKNWDLGLPVEKQTL